MMGSPWLAFLWFIPFVLAAWLAGGRLLRLLRVTDAHTPARTLFELAAGLMLLAYLVATVGLLGQLKAGVVLVIVAALAAFGLGHVREAAAGLEPSIRRAWRALQTGGGSAARLALAALGLLWVALMLNASGVVGNAGVWVGLLALVALLGLMIWRPAMGVAWVLVAWFAVTMIGALAPPADSDWDGLAEHLAQAKVYAHDGRYEPLWYDHHSHFPALTEMLFTVGMLYQGPALAKLFHWLYGLIGLGACFALGERTGRGAGKWAALVYATTPIVSWLMQVAYVDLTTAAYGLLAALAFVSWLRRPTLGNLTLSALMAAGGMASKMQGIALFGVLLAGVMLVTLLRRGGLGCAVKRAAAYGLIAGAVACPWYVKTWLLTGNPVYPFAYGLFGGKYWGPNEAQGYDYHQKEFGVDHLPPPEQYYQLPRLRRMFVGPRSPKNLLLAPWNITFNPVAFTVQWRRGNEALLPILLTGWIGPAYLFGLLGALLLRRRGPLPQPAAAVLWLFLPLWVWWLMSMQLERYLMTSLVLLAPVVGWVLWRVERTLARVVMGLWAAVALGGVAVVASPAAAVVCGMIPTEDYLRLMSPVYEPSSTLNRVVPEDGKVILYGEPRGFYIDRPYLWGDPGHHRMIPYDQLTTPEALVKFLQGMGVTHVLINQAQAGRFEPTTGPPVGLLAQALERGLVELVPQENQQHRQYVILSLRPR
jgi:hypothetical protein